MPVRDANVTTRLRSLLATYLSDNRTAWDLNSDGTYTQRMPDGADIRSAQEQFMQEPWGVPRDDLEEAAALS